MNELQITTTNEPTDIALPRKRSLSFTVVSGHLKGEHTCAFEVHATGCRDLKKLQRTQPSVEVISENPDGVIEQAVTEMKGMTGRKDYWVQPCCLLKRMQAAGRA